MSEEILINVTPQETRVAVVENGILQEIYVERSQKLGLVGSIFKGSVSRVLPGMQAAFINIGLERTGFLHTSDIVSATETSPTDDDNSTQQPAIESLLREGQDVLVQVVKDPLGSKGARLTTRLSIPLRYLVFIPNSQYIGISQRIEDETERERLRSIILNYESENLALTTNNDSNDTSGKSVKNLSLLDKGGFIVRTAAEGISDDEIYRDIEFLHKLWDSVVVRADNTYPPGVVY
ncbi:MAG: Rne/Rng family ribonuclease, partial [Gammaproteobacteria bacterium]